MKRHANPVLLSIAALGIATPATALQFNFLPEPGTSQAAIDGFAAAGGLAEPADSDDRRPEARPSGRSPDPIRRRPMTVATATRHGRSDTGESAPSRPA